MGQIINVAQREGDLPEPLTNTTESGFRSGEYLGDRPAIAAVEDGETVQFVMTNRQQGIAIQGDTKRHVLPDSRYQTVVVVTDRRVLGLVGNVGGDRELALGLSEITDVTTATKGRTGQLTIDRADGPTWKIQTDADGLDDVATYLRRRSDACRGAGRVRAATQSLRGLVETTMDSAKSFERDRVAELLPSADEPEASSTATASPTDRQAAETERDSERPDTETAIDEILQALAKTDWTARSAQAESPFDLVAEREDELVGVVVHCPADGSIPRSTIKRCEMITGAAGTDTVMLATTATVRDVDARRAAELGVRLRNVETLSDTADPPTIAAVTEMVSTVLSRGGWSVRSAPSGPFDLLADDGNELLGVVVHGPEDGTVQEGIEHCAVVTGAAGTDTVVLATTGTVHDADVRRAEELGVRVVESEALAQHHVTAVDREAAERG